MRTMRMAVAAAVVLATSAALSAADLESGIPVGGKIGTYSTTKCGGAQDGVSVGKSLCYT